MHLTLPRFALTRAEREPYLPVNLGARFST
jgi:hypothetical protein